MLLRRGSNGASVMRLQKMLAAQGFFAVADGIFGPATEAAVKEFQKAHGLTADGIVGLITWSALLSKGAFLVEPFTRWYGFRRVEGWHVKMDRCRVKPRAVWATDPVVLRKRNDARQDGRTEPWRRLPLTQLAGNAPLAINACFFDPTGWPVGPTIDQGQPINGGNAIPPDEFVVVVTQPDLSLAQQSATIVYDLINLGVKQAFSTIPVLVRGGRKQIGGHDPGHDGPAPRTLLGWNDTEIHAATIDGRSWRSGGISMNEAADLLLNYGCKEGVNMDSGGSAEMVLDGMVLNRPSDGQERPLPGALAFEMI